MIRDLTPWPPLHCGEGEEPAGRKEELTGHKGVIRDQKINPKKLELAKGFRMSPTESEDAVWQILRNRQIKNLKWRRQQVIDGFIADFYCAELNVALEIDGKVHDNEETKEYDECRSVAFESKGIRTFRLRNEECDKEHLTELIENIINSLR